MDERNGTLIPFFAGGLKYQLILLNAIACHIVLPPLAAGDENITWKKSRIQIDTVCKNTSTKRRIQRNQFEVHLDRSYSFQRLCPINPRSVY